MKFRQYNVEVCLVLMYIYEKLFRIFAVAAHFAVSGIRSEQFLQLCKAFYAYQ